MIKKLFNVNEDNKLIEISDVKIANTFLTRLIGLMFRKNIEIPLLFEVPKSKYNSRSTIHTCFMRFEIVIIFIDWDNKINEIIRLKPWQYYTPKKPSKYIIEIKKSEFYKYSLKKGDKIILR